MRAGIVNNSNNLIENVIELELGSSFSIEGDFRIVFSDKAEIGQCNIGNDIYTEEEYNNL
jgi:hypothetical protein